MVWNVFYHNINSDQVELFDIFKHSGFCKDFLKAVKKHKNKNAFIVELRLILLYYFRSKSEWEIIIAPWVGSQNSKPIKIDIYDQIQNNWSVFANYCWEHRKKLKG